jgi:hypothetical protein
MVQGFVTHLPLIQLWDSLPHNIMLDSGLLGGGEKWLVAHSEVDFLQIEQVLTDRLSDADQKKMSHYCQEVEVLVQGTIQ